MPAATLAATTVLAIPLLKRLEGCVLAAYPDPESGGDPWTIGYGATGPDIRRGVVWTQQQADEDLARRVGELVLQLGALVKRPLPAQSTAALVSLAYNVGIDRFASSTLLRKLNTGDTEGAAVEFGKWIHAAGHVSKALVIRRGIEQQTFLAGIRQAAAPAPNA